MSLIDKLKSVTPTVFENIAYDLLAAAGMTNIVWRTPGADRGRDIEGQFPIIDFSGNSFSERWYVECKRYESSIDWPTVHGKLAYANNHKANFLLFITTSTFSPNCIDEVNKWNNDGHSTKIRCWPNYDFENRLKNFPDILLKYGLDTAPTITSPAFLQLAEQIAKASSAAVGRDSILVSNEENIELIFSASLSELLLVRMQQFNHEKKTYAQPFKFDEDKFEWLELQKGDYKFDRYALRALFILIRMITKIETIKFLTSSTDQILEISIKILTRPKSDISLIELIAFWGHFHIQIENEKMVIYE